MLCNLYIGCGENSSKREATEIKAGATRLQNEKSEYIVIQFVVNPILTILGGQSRLILTRYIIYDLKRGSLFPCHTPKRLCPVNIRLPSHEGIHLNHDLFPNYVK